MRVRTTIWLDEQDALLAFFHGNRKAQDQFVVVSGNNIGIYCDVENAQYLDQLIKTLIDARLLITRKIEQDHEEALGIELGRQADAYEPPDRYKDTTYDIGGSE